MLFEGGEIVDGALRLEIMNLLANGFGHSHRGVVSSDEKVGAGLGDGRAPIDGWNGRLIEAGFASVAGDADNFSRTGIAKVGSLQMMANDLGIGEISIREGAIDDDGRRAIRLAAERAFQHRDFHGREIAGGNEMV